MAAVSRCFLIFFCALYVKADDIEFKARSGVMLKVLRDMVNQTKADTLNLPANASSIRENITDTFSCENRTYGYYADVDNECQVFHVCLTSELSTGRNVTYRWSFICPNETIFNQEVLTCTRPRDAIDCEDSPMYYDINMDIGKVSNETDKKITDDKAKNDRKPVDTPERVKERRKPVRKQNIIAQSLMEEVVREVEKDEMLEDSNFMVEDFEKESSKEVEILQGNLDGIVGSAPIVTEVMKQEIHEVNEDYVMKDMKNSRIAAERSLKRKGRKIDRGSFKFRINV